MATTFQRQAFLILTQHVSPHVLKLHGKICEGVKARGDVFLLYHSRDGTVPEVPEGVSIVPFTNHVLSNSGYTPIRNTLIPGSNHFPVLQFFTGHPGYDHYWCIEDDVVFNGSWEFFFNRVSEAGEYDFVSSHIRRYADVPRWYWWNTLTLPDVPVKRELMVCSFNPIYRISARALAYIDQRLRNGCTGHHEVLLPTLLSLEGFSLADLATDENNFTPCLKLCTLGTMRWQPVFFSVGRNKNSLYHPVKGSLSLRQVMVFIRRTIRNRKKYFS